MKKFVVFLMMVTLLLSAACGKQPQNPTVPTEPSEPATEAPTQAPVEAPTQAPTEPAAEAPTEAPTEPVSEPPAIVEPEGFVSVVKLPGDVHAILPLNEQVSVVLGEFDDGWQLMTYNYRTAVVMGKLSVECYESAGAPALLETDPYVLLYQDGRYDWKVAVDDDWQMTREKTDVQALQRQMGDFTVETPERGITLDGKPISVLQPNDRVSYALVRVLNDHQLLYYATDRNILSLSHYGVYDHTTGETRAVTTMGQQVIGTWGENLLVGLWAENGWYNLGLIRLEDMRYTKLDVDSDTPKQAVSGIELNREGTRAVTLRSEAGGNTLQVFSIPEGELLYQWTAPSDEAWHFDLTSEHSIVFWKTQSGGMTLWTVEY